MTTLCKAGLLSVILSVSMLRAAAQIDLARAPYPAANLWMTYPVSWSPGNDALTSSVREQRDQYFDKLIGLPTPITSANMRTRGYSEGVILPSQPEILDVPNRAVAIGTFVSYAPVLSRSGKSIYTEVTLSLSDVFQDAGGNTAGHTITLILPGGTVNTPTGTTLSFLTQPRQYSIKPGGTYLFVMSFHSDGNFYVLAQDWDLASGTVQPNFSVPKSSRSTLIGLTVQQLKNRLAQGIP